MHKLVTIRTAASLTILVSGALMTGLSQGVAADPMPVSVSASTPQSTMQPLMPVVKLGSAMLQEQMTFSDGSVHRETFIDQQTSRSAQAVKTSAVKDKPKA